MTRERLQDEQVEIWLRAGLTALFVTHAIEEAIFLADRVVASRVDADAVRTLRGRLSSAGN
jgi:NitT/TauT family transport system ATP-binding protein